jgi:hypothetical protein
VSLATLIEGSRLIALRKAATATFRLLMSDVTVKEHLGRLDISDVIARDFINAPAVLVALTRIKTEDRLSHSRDVPVEMTAYVIAEDAALGQPPRRFERDEIGYAIGDAVLSVLRSDAKARWGLDDIGYPDGQEMRPVFTMQTFEKGTAVYAVTWSQILYNCHEPFMEMESTLSVDAITILGPGDPDPTGGAP